MVVKYLKPSDKVIHLAHRISYYAHMPWVMAYFFFSFFFDSFIMFIPADGLLAVAVLFAPDKKRVWFLIAVFGSLLGFLVTYILTLSSLQYWLIDLIVEYDSGGFFRDITTQAVKYGYLNLSLAVFTVVPPIICLLAGIVIGLNPLAVFAIVFVSKVFRIALMIFLVRKLWAGVIFVKHKIHDVRERKKIHSDEGSQ